MKKHFPALSAMLLAGAAGAVGAAEFVFEGSIANHNDVVRIDFTLAFDALNVRVWTDSFLAGENFDPVVAVWSLPSGAKVGENDDDGSIVDGRKNFDSGLVFGSLGTGRYSLTITPYANFAPDNLFLPFPYTDQSPIPIADWCQPSSIECTDQKGTFWRVHLSGVDAAAPVPEPAAAGLLLTGLALSGLFRSQARSRPCPRR